MPKRTEHGRRRHQQGNRPTREAFSDRKNPQEIYLDTETGYTVYVGMNGRTHIFTADGKHHTSFRTTVRERLGKARSGRWVRQQQAKER